LLSPPDATPISGDIVVRGFAPFIQPEQKIVAGSWESEPGISRWEFLSRGEFIHVIAGRMTVQEDGQEPLELTTGMSAVFPMGWTGIWTVHETLRKVFVIFKE
jgi:uncharacterized cupin superfamily protein